MSSVIDMETCPRCNNESLLVDYDLRTGEHDYSCEKCGYYHHFSFQYDENMQLIKEDIAYPRENLIFGITDIEGYRFIWHKDLSEIDNLNEYLIIDFLNGVKVFEDMPIGIPNIFDKTQNNKQLYIRGNSFRIDNEDTLVLEKALSETDEYKGFGVIMINLSDGSNEVCKVSPHMNREDTIKLYEQIISSFDEDEIVNYSVTWFNPCTNHLEELI